MTLPSHLKSFRGKKHGFFFQRIGSWGLPFSWVLRLEVLNVNDAESPFCLSLGFHGFRFTMGVIMEVAGGAIIHGGQIVFNGDLASLYQQFLPKKQIKILFYGPWARDQLAQLGNLTRVDTHEAVLEVDTAATARVASLICGRFSIRDITITEAPLERIIESIYARQGR